MYLSLSLSPVRWYIEILRFIVSILPKQDKKPFLSELMSSWHDYITELFEFTDVTSDESGKG